MSPKTDLSEPGGVISAVSSQDGLGPKQTTQDDLVSDSVRFFDIPAHETAMEYCREFEAFPMEPLQTRNEFSFNMPGQFSLYPDPKSFRLVGELCVEKTNTDRTGWVAVETIMDEHIVREIIPQLKAAGAEGIIEYPLNKVVY